MAPAPLSPPLPSMVQYLFLVIISIKDFQVNLQREGKRKETEKECKSKSNTITITDSNNKKDQFHRNLASSINSLPQNKIPV